MREDERQRLLMVQALAGRLDEDVVAIGLARRELAYQDSWRKGPRALKRWLARGDHPADRLGEANLLVLTPTRVLVFAGRTKAPLIRVRRLAGAWPIDDVHLETHYHTVEATYGMASNTVTRNRHRIIRAELTWPGEERPLVLDLHADAVSRAVVKAIKEATGQRTSA